MLLYACHKSERCHYSLPTQCRSVLRLQPGALRSRRDALRTGGFAAIALYFLSSRAAGRFQSATMLNPENTDLQLSQALHTLRL
jgi:hypothetical protein